jgi:hypothetical protein
VFVTDTGGHQHRHDRTQQHAQQGRFPEQLREGELHQQGAADGPDRPHPLAQSRPARIGCDEPVPCVAELLEQSVDPGCTGGPQRVVDLSR